MKDTLKIGLLGLGTVGTGVLTLLKEHQEKISQVTGMNVVIEKAFLSPLPLLLFSPLPRFPSLWN